MAIGSRRRACISGVVEDDGPSSPDHPSGSTAPPLLAPRLFSYIWRHSKRDQLAICAVVLASLPFYFASLDLPKRIVNDAITGKAYAHGEVTAPFLALEIDWPASLGGGRIHVFDGFQLDRLELLLGLSTLFLMLVLSNGAFKFWINLQKGMLGERMLRRLRFQLFSLMLRYSPQAQREVKSSETATIIRDEVEPIGSFIGDAIVTPLHLGTQALTTLAFILMQNVWLGLAAGGMVGVQIAVIPRLRRQIIGLSRQRQIASRAFAGRVAEVLDGLDTVTVNEGERWERSEISGRLHGIYDLRMRIYKRKFAVKYLNNLLAQITPFLFYAIGGMFALKGRLDIGQLVAVLAAYRDLPPPLKELIDWDQQRLDVEVKYETIAAQFAPRLLRTAEVSAPGFSDDSLNHLAFAGLILHDPQEDRSVAVTDIALPLPPRFAVVSPGSGLAHAAAMALAGLRPAVGGSLRLDVGGGGVRAVGYAGREPTLFPGSIRDNLIYGLRVAPLAPPEDPLYAAEARRTGNTPEASAAPWIDHAALGAADACGFDRTMLHLVCRLGLEEDLYRFGLTARSRCEGTPLGTRMIAARRFLREELAHSGHAGLVLPFERRRYNARATIAENLLFGVPVDQALVGRDLAAEPRFRAVLTDLDLIDPLWRLGVAIARTLVDLFRGVAPGDGLFRRFSLIEPEELPEVERLLGAIPEGTVPAPHTPIFLAIALSYVEPVQRLGLLDDALRRRVVGARDPLHEALRTRGVPDVEAFDPDRINMRSSMLDNLLFGRIDAGHGLASDVIQAAVRGAVRRFELEDDVRVRGLDYAVGNRGQALTQRQRALIEIGRAALRQPRAIIIDGTLRHISDLDRVIATLSEGPYAPGCLIVCAETPAEAAAMPVQIVIGATGRTEILQAHQEPVTA
ncbi:putative ABC transport system ATP-binding protein [Methylobacterium phyllostachyos]|uniref:Putative ABC transport system ATP-binding protein n=1 Tax=Methylobacterium phyllostachyos TaxID=582672 RepID=A0A1G9S546_9HYPH|nr:putative ABC transport system ATP-binding protein [Methylobacterium phyllostachyos]